MQCNHAVVEMNEEWEDNFYELRAANSWSPSIRSLSILGSFVFRVCEATKIIIIQFIELLSRNTVSFKVVG